MPCRSRVMMWMALAALSPGACSRANPSFGGDAGGSAEGGSTTNGDDAGEASMSSSPVTTLDSSDADASSDPSIGEEEGPAPMECGDGIISGTEECDDGPENADDHHCQPDCTKNQCGDGKPGPGQPCDDANDRPDDGCDGCKLTSCGDGVPDPGEACDEGPVGGLDCTPLCTKPECGDGIFTRGREECEDDDDDVEDECHECILSFCGDGITWEGMEECDDENEIDGDGCDHNCIEEFCGDGIVQPGLDEECDGLDDALSCVQDRGAESALFCDPEACVWVYEGGADCCMPAEAPCIEAVPCCGEMGCGNRGLCESGG